MNIFLSFKLDTIEQVLSFLMMAQHGASICVKVISFRRRISSGVHAIHTHNTNMSSRSVYDSKALASIIVGKF